MKLSKKTIAVSTASLLIVGGSAFAYIQATGSGSGTGATATITPLNIGGTVSGLGPSLTKPVAGTFVNTNEFPVKATSVTISLPASGDAFWTTSHCVFADFSTTAATASSGMIEFPVSPAPGGTWSSAPTPAPTVTVVGGSVKMTSSDESQNDCQTYLAASGHSIPLTFAVI